MSGKKFLSCFGLVFLFSTQLVFAQNYAGGELLVKYKNGTASRAATKSSGQIGARVVEEFPDLKWQRVKLPADLSVDEAIKLYKSNAEVETVQPNFYYHLLNTPDDARVSELYGMQKISAPAAWDLSTGNAAIVVANIDSGVKYTHEDLAANIWRNAGEIQGNHIDDDGNGFVDDYYGWDFFYNDADPMDENGHGTHTSGTIGAVGDNSLGVAGVNWNVRIMAIKIYSPNGNDTTSAMLINAYNYIRMMKNRGVNIRVTNNSYGGCSEACGYDQATKDAIDALGNAGILQVFAAGNDGRNIETTPFYPASYTTPSILSVAASDQNDNRAGFSNFGTTSVDLAAPGVGILSTVMSAGNYGSLSGTSMATPHAAGSAALLASYNPNLSAASIKATLMNAVDALPQWNGVVKTGGRLNVARALQNPTVCAYTLDRSGQSVFPEGGTYRFTVTAPANCDYTAASNANWIQITGGAPGSGGGTITFTVGTNSRLPRNGAITVGGQTFSVTQSANENFPHRGFLDFNGDGRSDFTAIQNASGGMLWHVFQGAEGYKTFNFGLFADDVPVPGHYDADLKSDIAVWRNSNGTFYVLRSQDNTFQAVQFGASGDNPVVTQDFDADEKADFAVTRKVDGKLVWYILGSASGFSSRQFGNATDRPLRGDYDGDGRADLAVYRPETGTWYIQKSRDGFAAVQFGVSTDKTVAADYDGDRKTDIAVWRPETGVWHYLKSSDGSYNAAQFGISRDLPTPGDYDGDGRTDFSVWRPNSAPDESGAFYVYSVLSGFSAFGWGNSTMKIPANTLQSP